MNATLSYYVSQKAVFLFARATLIETAIQGEPNNIQSSFSCVSCFCWQIDDKLTAIKNHLRETPGADDCARAFFNNLMEAPGTARGGYFSLYSSFSPRLLQLLHTLDL